MWILDVLILSWLFAGVFKTIKSGNALNPFNRSATIPLRGILAIMIIIHHFPVWYPKEYACIVNVLFPASGNQYKCLPLWQKTKVTKLCQ